MCLVNQTESSMGYVMNEDYPNDSHSSECNLIIRFSESTNLTFQFLQLDLASNCSEASVSIKAFPSDVTIGPYCESVNDTSSVNCQPEYNNVIFTLTGEYFEISATTLASSTGFLLFYYSMHLHYWPRCIMVCLYEYRYISDECNSCCVS